MPSTGIEVISGPKCLRRIHTLCFLTAFSGQPLPRQKLSQIPYRVIAK